MQPYRWYDPAELVEEAEAYVRDIEERHHSEKTRMYSAMSDENHRLRLMANDATSKLADLAALSPSPPVFFVTAPSPEAIKTARQSAENVVFNLTQTGKALAAEEAVQICQRIVDLLTPAKVA